MISPHIVGCTGTLWSRLPWQLLYLSINRVACPCCRAVQRGTVSLLWKRQEVAPVYFFLLFPALVSALNYLFEMTLIAMESDHRGCIPFLSRTAGCIQENGLPSTQLTLPRLNLPFILLSLITRSLALTLSVSVCLPPGSLSPPYLFLSLHFWDGHSTASLVVCKFNKPLLDCLFASVVKHGGGGWWW